MNSDNMQRIVSDEQMVAIDEEMQRQQKALEYVTQTEMEHRHEYFTKGLAEWLGFDLYDDRPGVWQIYRMSNRLEAHRLCHYGVMPMMLRGGSSIGTWDLEEAREEAKRIGLKFIVSETIWIRPSPLEMEILKKRDRQYWEHCHKGGLMATTITNPVERLTNLSKSLQAKATVKQVIATPSPGRNDICPCGSGQKFKKCCGR